MLYQLSVILIVVVVVGLILEAGKDSKIGGIISWILVIIILVLAGFVIEISK